MSLTDNQSSDSSEDVDAPTRQVLKIVEVLECVPGHAGRPDGEPITILTIGHLGEVEQPMALTIKDTEKLLVDCLASLAHHGDEFAQAILARFFGDDDSDDPDDDDDDDDEFDED